MTAAFDYQPVAGRLVIGSERLAELEGAVRRQYGRDEMMVELRMLRTLHAVEEGALTLDEAIAEFRSDADWPAARSA